MLLLSATTARWAAAPESARTVCRKSALPCARHALKLGRGLDYFAARLLHLNGLATPTQLKVRVLGNSVAEWNHYLWASTFVKKLNAVYPGVSFSFTIPAGSHRVASGIGGYLPQHAVLCEMRDLIDADVVLVFFNNLGDDALLNAL